MGYASDLPNVKVERKNGTWPAAVVGLLGVGATTVLKPELAVAVMAVAGPVVAAVAVRVKVWLDHNGIGIN